jgi:hypothetical protein
MSKEQKTLYNVDVWIAERIDGIKFSVSFIKEKSAAYINFIDIENSKISVEIKEFVERKAIWNDDNIINIIKNIAEYDTNIKTIEIFGVIIGPEIKKNLYKQDEMNIYFTNMKINDKFISTRDFFNHALLNYFFHFLIPTYEKNIKLKDWVEGTTYFEKKSSLKSLLNPNIKAKGLIIRPIKIGYN